MGSLNRSYNKAGDCLAPPTCVLTLFKSPKGAYVKYARSPGGRGVTQMRADYCMGGGSWPCVRTQARTRVLDNNVSKNSQK